MNSPFLVSCLNSNALLERSASSTLTSKTRNISSAANIAYLTKKQPPQAQVFPVMKSISPHVKISTRQNNNGGFTLRRNGCRQILCHVVKISARHIIAGSHPNSTRYMSFRYHVAGNSKDQVESESNQLFISFRGEMRCSFIGHLYKRLTLAGYSVFIDELMRRGENIEKELIKAIRHSEVSVVVISPGYASSQSCLNELVEILRCMRCFGLKVLPVFNLVRPDHIRNLTGEFGANFDGLVKSLEDAKDYKMVIRYKEALKELADTAGLVHRQNEHEANFIDKIVAEVEKQLSAPPQNVPSFVVGWRCFIYGFNSWLQTALCIIPYIIAECAGLMVAAIKHLFGRLNEALMVIRLGMAISVYLGSMKRTDKARNDSKVNSVSRANDSLP